MRCSPRRRSSPGSRRSTCASCSIRTKAATPRSRARWRSSGDWVTPRLNDLKYFEKPPLQYWVGAAAFNALRRADEWTARLPLGDGGIARGDRGGLHCGTLGRRRRQARTPRWCWPARVWHAGLAPLADARCACSRSGSRSRCARSCSRSAPALAIGAAQLDARRVRGRRGRDVDQGPRSRWSSPARRWCSIRSSRATSDRGDACTLLPGIALYLALTAPWFVLVSRADPEFAQFFFVHEHFERFLTTDTQPRPAGWYYSSRGSCSGILPWLLVWVVDAAAKLARRAACANGFRWRTLLPRLGGASCSCSSASPGPSCRRTFLPDVSGAGAGARLRVDADVVTGAGVDRVAARRSAALLLHRLGAGVWQRGRSAMRDRARRRRRSIAPFAPWLAGRRRVFAVGGIAAFAWFRSGTPAARRWASPRLSLVGADRACSSRFVGDDAFAVYARPYHILREAERANGGPLDPAFRCTRCEATTRRCRSISAVPTPLVEYRDEMAPGLDAEPRQGIQTEAHGSTRGTLRPWRYALMPADTAAELARRSVPIARAARAIRAASSWPRRLGP